MGPLICPSCGSQTPRLAATPGAPVHCLKCRAPIPAEVLAPSADGGAEAEGPTPYPVQPFQPIRGGPPLGVLAALATGLLGALVLGVVAAVVRQFFWLVLIFALLLGFGVGVTASVGAWFAKCRITALVVGAGAVAGFACGFAMHYISYLIATAGALPAARITFPEYLDVLCQAGVQISGLNLGYTGSIVYYAVEVLVIAVAAGSGAMLLLNRPFCETCSVWKQKEKLGTFKINANVAAWAVGSGRPKVMAAPPEGDETVTLELFRCPHCRNTGPIDVRATCTKTENKNTASAVVFVTYPGEAAADFEEAARACRS